MATFQPDDHRYTDVTACQEEDDDLRAALRTHHSRRQAWLRQNPSPAATG